MTLLFLKLVNLETKKKENHYFVLIVFEYLMLICIDFLHFLLTFSFEAVFYQISNQRGGGGYSHLWAI